MLCSSGANGSHKGQQPVSVWWHDIEYLDRKKLERAVDGLTDRNNYNSFLSFRRYSQPYVLPGYLELTLNSHLFPRS
jgi:hypothetical protein